MILQLSGADFSQSNIGQVEIPHELSDFTKEFLTHYSKSLTDSQKYAVDNFLMGMQNSGLWDKLHFIFFPVLASSLPEAFYNPLGKSDLPSNYKGYTIANNGLKIDLENAGWSVGEPFNGGHPTIKSEVVDINVTTQGWHYAMYASQNVDSEGILMSSFINGIYPALYHNRALICYGKTVPRFSYGSIPSGFKLANCVPYQEGAVYSLQTSFLLGDKSFATDNDVQGEQAMVAADNGHVYNGLQPLCNGDMNNTTTQFKNNTDTAYLWSVGKSMTREEALAYSQLVSVFMAGMGV